VRDQLPGAEGVVLITRVAGIRVGHWTDSDALTGCTVVLLPAGSVASGEVRGGAPGTREWALLDPRCSVAGPTAVVMSGGSAFGLAACDGVVRWCEERGLGQPTPAGPVPIVVGMVLFDLMVGDPSVRPSADAGYAACTSALAAHEAQGLGAVGAGCGATVGKWEGSGRGRAAGLGCAEAEGPEGLLVGALVAVNAYGDLRPGHRAGDKPRLPSPRTGAAATSQAGLLGATTIGVILTNAELTKVDCRRVAEAGHDGLARAIDPVHTGYDGDALVAAATGELGADVEVVRSLAAWVVEQAAAAGAGRR
jgi:L-aminopeptidase/D-esterase-like protein